MTDMPATKPRRWSFWLIASLCLNLFLIGVIVMGLIVARNRAALTAATGGGLRPEVILQMLPTSGALKMCTILRDRTETYRRLGREVADARREMFRLFRAEPLDETEFRKSLARMTAAENAVAAERQATVGDLTTRLTTDERRHFAREVTLRFLSPSKPNPPPMRGQAALARMCRDLGVK